MLYKRQGLPEEEEIVLCKVTKLFPNAVFVELLEYGEQGIVHISEVSPGRIRNLRDFVSIDRQIVCKVLRVDKINHHLDLSLRRVNSTQRIQKLDEIKQELKAEALIKNLSQKLSIPFEELYKKISVPLFKEYSHIYLCFKDIVAGQTNIEKLGLDKKIAQELTDAVIEKFKPKKIELKGEMRIETYAPDGIEKIKATLTKIEKVSPTVRTSYLGAGRYKIVIEDIDYKPAEKNIKKIEELLNEFNDKLSTASFEREKATE